MLKRRLLPMKRLSTPVAAALVFACSSICLAAAAPTYCSPRPRYYGLLMGSHNRVAVGVRLDVGLYATGITTKFVKHQLQALPIRERIQYPEWLFVKKVEVERAGNLHGFIGLYMPGPSQSNIKLLYSGAHPMRDVKRQARQVSSVRFLYKAQLGPLAQVQYSVVSPEFKNIPGSAIDLGEFCEQNNAGRWLFVNQPPGTKFFANLASLYPYWLPAKKRRFTPTGSYFEIVRHYSKKYPKPDAAVYIRKIHVFDPQIVKAVRHIVHVYQTGSDKDVLAMWRPKDRKRIAKCLAHPNEYTNLRENYRDTSGHNISFRAYPSIIGKDVSLILLQRVGGGDIGVVRLAKIAGKWYQSRESGESASVDWLPKYPAYEAYVLGHPKLAVLIRSRGH